MKFALSTVGSAAELVRLLPGLHEEEDVSTLVVNTARGWTVDGFVGAFRRARGLVSDQDGTVTPGAQWLGFHAYMTPEQVARDKVRAAAYFAGHRTPEDDRRFLLENVSALIALGMTRADFGRLAAGQPPRAGARALFRSFEACASVSYGVRPVLKSWSFEHGVPIHRFYALKLLWEMMGDRAGRCIGYEEGTAVVETTKGDARAHFCAEHGIAGHELVALEDTPKALVHLRSPDGLAVLVLPRIDPLADRPAQRIRQLTQGECFPDVDAFLVSDSLYQLAALRS